MTSWSEDLVVSSTAPPIAHIIANNARLLRISSISLGTFFSSSSYSLIHVFSKLSYVLTIFM